MGKDIVDVAIGEIGTREQGRNSTKYGKWYGMNGAAWCHMFVSWCANQAGVSTSIVPKTASTSAGMAWFKKRGLFRYKGKYKPGRGDIVYFKTGRSHVGIVEKVTGNTLHTIEGNTSDRVARRTYPLSHGTITGYGTPKYKNLNDSGSSGGSSGSSGKKKASKKELAYLKKVLKRQENKKKKSTNIKADAKATGKLPNGIVTVTVKNGKKRHTVPVKEGMKITWERSGTPGKLTFEAKYDKQFKILEGNEVLVTVDGRNFFFGYIFSRQIKKDGLVSYTAYDQLRYLKNEETLIYKNKTASQVIKIIAERFQLNCGKLADTGYKRSAVEDSTTLFDMIQNALDDTLMVKGKVYVLYDKCGRLRLTDVSSMKVNSCLVDQETGEEFTYKVSIDSDVYNQIKLIYENKKKGSYDLYVTKHSKNINKWGVLQYVDKIDNPDIGKLKSKALLKLYNKKQRNLTVSGVIGNRSVRAGSLVPVMLDLYDIKVANYMMAEKVTHIFNNRQYSMDLVLSGGDFSG